MDDTGFLLFRGHTPPPDGRVGSHCLSQWWPAPFTDARRPERWPGTNLLGLALMRARDALRAQVLR